MNDFLQLNQSAIHQAAASGDAATLSKLLSAGQDINAKLDAAEGWGIFYLGVTPLMVAACSPMGATVDTLRWLIEHGADAALQATGQITAAWYAAGDGIFPGARDGHNPLERLRLLLTLGADPNETADNGRSLLIEACRIGDPQRVALLLEKGASVQPRLDEIAPHYQYPWAENCSPLSGYQIPLFCAVSSGSADCVQLLLDAGADVHLRTNDGATPLMYARNPNTVQLLLEAGVDMTIMRKQGWDAFQEILSFDIEDEQEESEILRSLHLLIQQGADINATQRGEPRIYHAAFACNPFAIERLLKLGATPTASQPLLSAITWHCNSEFDEEIARAIDLLVATGANINAQDAAGDTLLHNATSGYGFPSSEENFFGSSDGCNYTAVTRLLTHGAAPDLVGTMGRTPLMLAAGSASAKTLQALLSAGADPHRKDAAGQSAIDFARHAYTALEIEASNYKTPKDQEIYQASLQARAACLDLLGSLM
ncbi:MAG: ankyrin repeat domain-containing protein [Leptolyngbyaceae cyanobacterium]